MKYLFPYFATFFRKIFVDKNALKRKNFGKNIGGPGKFFEVTFEAAEIFSLFEKFEPFPIFP